MADDPPRAADDQAGIDDQTDDDAETDDPSPADGGHGNGSRAPMTGWKRLSQTFLSPPPPKQARKPAPAPAPVDFSAMTDAEIRARITAIDSTERKVGVAAAVLAAVLGVVGTVPYMISKTVVATSTKPVGKTCPAHLKYTVSGKGAATCNGVLPLSHYAFDLVVLLVFAVAIYVTVRIGRRSPLAFAVTITGLALGTLVASTFIVLPFLAAGGWLLLRAWRTQKNGSPTAKAPLPGYVRPAQRGSTRARPGGGKAAARSGSGRGRSGSGRGRSGSGGAPGSDGVRRPPTANKRYTPKSPPKKKLPPPE